MEWGLSDCYTDEGRHWLDIQTEVDDNSHTEIFCPYGVPGDRLWVRETWKPKRGYGYQSNHTSEDLLHFGCNQSHILYKATDEHDGEYQWRSPRFMPRWASRIDLENVDVRIQRVQEISEDDAVAEGCMEAHMEHDVDCIDDNCALAGGIDDCEGVPVLAKEEYAELWDTINAKRGFPWASNPWVWAITFKRV